MKPFIEKPVDIGPEREYAQHMAFRLIDTASAALLEGHSGAVHIVPPRDPVFSAIAGQSLSIIAQAIRHDRLPLRFLQELSNQDLSASSDVDMENGPDAGIVEAITTTSLHKESDSK